MSRLFLTVIFFFVINIAYSANQGFPTMNKTEIDNNVIGNLYKNFEQNPSDHNITLKLLKELSKAGVSGEEVVTKYFKTQKLEEYTKEYNWVIMRDYVNSYDNPQFKFLFKNQKEFIKLYSKDDVFQKLDNVLVDYLTPFYKTDKLFYNNKIIELKNEGYEHYDVVADYFNIKELQAKGDSENYFYKARKLFRYFPENREKIKEITKGALDIMTDVSRLKVIQLWAGKTVESKVDFDALYNYVVISHKCGYYDVAKRYAIVARKLAENSNNAIWESKVMTLYTNFVN